MTSLTLNALPIIVEKKRIKNMYIRIAADGRVKITAPMRTPDATIRAFAASRAGWIEKQRQKLAAQGAEAEPAYKSGEDCLVWGARYRLVVEYDRKSGVRIEGERAVLSVPEGFDVARRAEILARFYRALLEDAIPPLLEKYARIVGAQAASWRIRDMKTRWGSCNTREKRICLNLRLAKLPPECLEYVVVHELTHLLERGHNERFWAYMDRFYPDWRAVRARLNGKSGAHGSIF